MSELRQNLATKEWVIVSPERLKGKPFPGEQNALLDSVPEYDEKCPFCPRNEERFDNVEIEHIPHPDPGNAFASPWLVCCIENKFKIFQEYASCPTEPTEFDRDGIYCRFMGCGSHELVIESPQHNKSLATMSQEEVERVIEMYLRRFNALKKNPNNLLCIIFKNHGPRSGASQMHPHSQILGMRVVPNFLRFLIDEAQRYFDGNGVCVFCKMLKFELGRGVRTVCENDHFVSYVPYAGTVPFETSIFPKRHDALFGDMSDEEAAAFADCLRDTMGRLYRVLSNPDFNLVLRNPPYPMSGVPFYHWHMQIIPHTKTDGGFERGSRIGVNVLPPEQAAGQLRNVGRGK